MRPFPFILAESHNYSFVCILGLGQRKQRWRYNNSLTRVLHQLAFPGCCSLSENTSLSWLWSLKKQGRERAVKSPRLTVAKGQKNSREEEVPWVSIGKYEKERNVSTGVEGSQGKVHEALGAAVSTAQLPEAHRPSNQWRPQTQIHLEWPTLARIVAGNRRTVSCLHNMSKSYLWAH